MREIKFRAWNGEAMEYGGFSIHASAGKIQPIEGLTKVTNDSPLMQFTGLKDKNGKEIYEGDILKDTKENMVGKVWFQNGCFFTDCSGWGDHALCDTDDDDIEVIDNIYENKELLDD